MLPYGKLWELDHKLHPSGPRPPRTPRIRRRQALFLFVFSCILVTLFLAPYHISHIRREYLNLQREAAGLVLPKVDRRVHEEAYRAARDVLRRVMSGGTFATLNGKEGDGLQQVSVSSVNTAFNTVMYLSGSRLVSRHYNSALSDKHLSALAGSGAGRVWPLLEASEAELEIYRRGDGSRIPELAGAAPMQVVGAVKEKKDAGGGEGKVKSDAHALKCIAAVKVSSARCPVPAACLQDAVRQWEEITPSADGSWQHVAGLEERAPLSVFLAATATLAVDALAMAWIPSIMAAATEVTTCDDVALDAILMSRHQQRQGQEGERAAKHSYPLYCLCLSKTNSTRAEISLM